MSMPHTAAVPARRRPLPSVRDAVPADHAAIREVVIAAYGQYAHLIPAGIFSRYLASLVDLETHARYGRLLVVEADERVCAFGAFYPDTSVREVGFPPGWASGRALAVHPAARGHGVARTLLAAGERLARESGSPVLAFHTYSFMTSAIALYERHGYRRAPQFDLDLAARLGQPGAAPITAIAYVRWLNPGAAARPGNAARPLPHQIRPAKTKEPTMTCAIAPSCDDGANISPATEESMTTRTRTRPVETPAYYLGRPAAFWLAALARRPATGKGGSERSSQR